MQTVSIVVDLVLFVVLVVDIAVSRQLRKITEKASRTLEENTRARKELAAKADLLLKKIGEKP